MRPPALLWVMIVKEMRSMMRERQQIIGLLASLLVMVVAIGGAGWKFAKQFSPPPPGARPAAAHTQAATQASAPPRQQGVAAALGKLAPHVDINIVRWTCLGGGTAAGVLFSLGYIISATLASFAGEKDDRTLEILLAAPIGDTRLFVTKCLSVLLPMSAVGYLFLLIPVLGGAAFLREPLSRAPVHVLLYVLVLDAPVLFLIEASIVALGAIVSAKAETLKGANQAFGGIVVTVIFGGAYGIPLLLRYTPLRGPAAAFAQRWLSMPFVAQYLILLLVLAIIAVALMLIGRALFRRDRLLG